MTDDASRYAAEMSGCAFSAALRVYAVPQEPLTRQEWAARTLAKRWHEGRRYQVTYAGLGGR